VTRDEAVAALGELSAVARPPVELADEDYWWFVAELERVPVIVGKLLREATKDSPFPTQNEFVAMREGVYRRAESGQPVGSLEWLARLRFQLHGRLV
jgi:hypothetical protein